MGFRIKTNDSKPILAVTLTDYAGDAVDLTGAGVQFHMKKYGASSLKINSAAIIDSALTGKVSYQWLDGDTDVAGTYYGEMEVTYSDGLVETFPNNGYFTIIINEDLD